MHGEIISPSSKVLFWKMLKSEVLQRSFNRTAVWNLPKRNWLIRKLFGSIDGNPYLIQIPFHVSLGYNIHVGKNFFANCNCTMMDYAPITIGSGSTIGAGRVVTHDIPPNVLAFGVPCRVIRELLADEKSNRGGEM